MKEAKASRHKVSNLIVYILEQWRIKREAEKLSARVDKAGEQK